MVVLSVGSNGYHRLLEGDLAGPKDGFSTLWGVASGQ